MSDESEYLRFERDTDAEAGLKTQVWLVVSRSSDVELGQIRWFGRWHQYAFYPEQGTIWNQGCLADVNWVMRRLMSERRGPQKERR